MRVATATLIAMSTADETVQANTERCKVGKTFAVDLDSIEVRPMMNATTGVKHVKEIIWYQCGPGGCWNHWLPTEMLEIPGHKPLLNPTEADVTEREPSINDILQTISNTMGRGMSPETAAVALMVSLPSDQPGVAKAAAQRITTGIQRILAEKCPDCGGTHPPCGNWQPNEPINYYHKNRGEVH